MNAIKRIWIPAAMVAALYFVLGAALLGTTTNSRAHSSHGSRGAGVTCRPPRLFQNGEVARIAGNGRKVIVRSVQWNGREWIYTVVPK